LLLPLLLLPLLLLPLVLLPLLLPLLLLLLLLLLQRKRLSWRTSEREALKRLLFAHGVGKWKEVRSRAWLAVRGSPQLLCRMLKNGNLSACSS
jgi:hypothetical protein